MENLIVIGQWVIVGLAVGGLVYNVIVTNAIIKNDVKHLQKSVDSIWKKIDEIQKYLLERDKK